MPTKIDPVILGADRNTQLAQFDIGAVLKAIANDLVEFGQRGVQGVKIGNSWSQFLKTQRARVDLKKPYLQVGVANGHLVLLMLDKDNPKVDVSEVLVKDYVGLKRKLAASSASVSNIQPKSDSAVNQVVADSRSKLGLGANDPGFGEITGNIVLVAHGAPKTLPGGRLLGVRIGRKTPEDIVKMLTTSKDPKQRIPLTFDGTLTLCGCFTASGGPEAGKQDDPFALKVLQLFRKKGYPRISVVGYPGEVMTAGKDGEKDDLNSAMRRGDTKVAVGNVDQKWAAKLLADAEKLGKQTLSLESARTSTKQTVKKMHDALAKEIAKSGKTREAYLADGIGKQLNAKLQVTVDKLAKIEAESQKLSDAWTKATRALKQAGLDGKIAGLEGRFGLRTVN